MANIFKVPDWDNDVPGKLFKFGNKKRKNSLASITETLTPDAVSMIRSTSKKRKVNNTNLVNDLQLIDTTQQQQNTSFPNHTETIVENTTNYLNGRKQSRQKNRTIQNFKSIKKIPVEEIKKVNSNMNEIKIIKRNNENEKKITTMQKSKKIINNYQKNDIKSSAKKEKNQIIDNVTNNITNTNNADINTFHNKLVDNLKGSRFRYLNELLYSSSGAEAINIFKDDSNSFNAYHEGYRQQVEQWPLNPLNRMIRSLKKLSKNLIIADFGCGEGQLAKSIPQKVYSLDLIALNNNVIECDMANTPLKIQSIDIVVFCLSLMGTNLQDFIFEANRVLKISGQLKIAEVESRFTDVNLFIKNIEQCGFQILNKDLSNNLFYFLNFKKIKNISKLTQQQVIMNFNLKPCLYKKR